MSSPQAMTSPVRPTSSEVSPISAHGEIMTSSPGPRSLKRESTETQSSEAQDHPPKKVKGLEPDLDLDAPTNSQSSKESTGESGGPVAPVEDDPSSEDTPDIPNLATINGRARLRQVEERAEEARARQEIEEYEQARMETNFVQTMLDHQSSRRQDQIPSDEVARLPNPQAETSPPRRKIFYDCTGLARPPQELRDFATERSKIVMRVSEVVREQAPAVLGARALVKISRQEWEREAGDARLVQGNGDFAGAGQEQSGGNPAGPDQELGGDGDGGAAAGAGQEQGNSDSLSQDQEISKDTAAVAGQEQDDSGPAVPTSKGESKSVAFNEEVEVRTFSSNEVENADEVGFDSDRGHAEDGGLNDTQEDTRSDGDSEATTTPTTQAGPAEDPHVVRAEVKRAANIVYFIKLTGEADQADNSRLGENTRIKPKQLFEHDVVHSEIELNNVSLLASRFGTVETDYSEIPGARLIHVSLEDQFDKLESIILNGLSHGDLMEVFASNFLLSLTMRFYSDWIELSKDWHFWGNARSVEAVRLDMDLVKWIYRVLWHSTNGNTFWDATGVLRVRQDRAWTRRERRDSIDSNATEPESGDHGMANALGEPINDGEPQIKEVEWALKTSWLEWVRENELDQLYSAEDIHLQRTVWSLLVTEYSVLSRYGPHHTYRQGNHGAHDGNDKAGHYHNEDPHIIDDNDGDDGSAKTDSEDDVELVTTRSNYRNRMPTLDTPATEMVPGGSKNHPILVDEADNSTGILARLAQSLSRIRDYNNSMAQRDSTLSSPPTSKRRSTMSPPSLIVKLKIDHIKLALATAALLPPSSPLAENVSTTIELLRGKKRKYNSGHPGELPPAKRSMSTDGQPSSFDLRAADQITLATVIPNSSNHPSTPKSKVRWSAVSRMDSFHFNVIDPEGNVVDSSHPDALGLNPSS
ncbi:putative aryl-alcohol dehydrogenase [Venturia nashicola]|nr:putative aryl-alcohol dehydrogenase [Venturia nashicola]